MISPSFEVSVNERRKIMDPEKKYPFLSEFLQDFWLRHRKTLGLIIAAIVQTGQARSFAIATTLARWLKIRLDSAINRFYRLLRNANIDNTLLAIAWVRLLAKRFSGNLLVAMDWTEWPHDLRMLVAAVVSGKRAIPIFAQAYPRPQRIRSQNSRENTFLRILADAVHRAGAQATILCDRGFRRVSWLKLLQQLRLGFVIRLMTDVMVEFGGKRFLLSAYPLRRGQLVNFGVVPLRAEKPVMVRVIGYWAPKAKEPWWLATSEKGHARQVLKLYDRRMTVEEQFRDLKGRRFGAKLSWTQFRNPDQLARFTMLLGVALLVWLVTGIHAASFDRTLRLVCKYKGPRQSYVTIGLRICCARAHGPPLSGRRIGELLEPPAKRRLGRQGFGRTK
jgi:hypothetical protein